MPVRFTFYTDINIRRVPPLCLVNEKGIKRIKALISIKKRYNKWLQVEELTQYLELYESEFCRVEAAKKERFEQTMKKLLNQAQKLKSLQAVSSN